MQVLQHVAMAPVDVRELLGHMPDDVVQPVRPTLRDGAGVPSLRGSRERIQWFWKCHVYLPRGLESRRRRLTSGKQVRLPLPVAGARVRSRRGTSSGPDPKLASGSKSSVKVRAGPEQRAVSA